MNETIDSSGENLSPGNEMGDTHQIEAANALSSWKENVKDNLFVALLLSVAIGLLVGYLICQQHEEKKREQWAEILFRQARNWLTERGRDATGTVEQGLEYARSAAERPAEDRDDRRDCFLIEFGDSRSPGSAGIGKVLVHDRILESFPQQPVLDPRILGLGKPLHEMNPSPALNVLCQFPKFRLSILAGVSQGHGTE